MNNKRHLAGLSQVLFCMERCHALDPTSPSRCRPHHLKIFVFDAGRLDNRAVKMDHGSDFRHIELSPVDCVIYRQKVSFRKLVDPLYQYRQPSVCLNCWTRITLLIAPYRCGRHRAAHSVFLFARHLGDGCGGDCKHLGAFRSWSGKKCGDCSELVGERHGNDACWCDGWCRRLWPGNRGDDIGSLVTKRLKLLPTGGGLFLFP